MRRTTKRPQPVLPGFLISTITLLPRENRWLFLQDHAKERTVHMKSAVVTNEAQLPEFIHKEIDPGACCANHLRQHFLRNFGAHLLRFGFAAIAREQQKSARQPFFAGVKKRIDQILLDANVLGKEVRHEAVGERVSGWDNSQSVV